MSNNADPFLHHPGLRDKITDPLQSFFRTFEVETVLAQHPELAWVKDIIHTPAQREENRSAVLRDHGGQDLWVFAYGSLMWDPAFVFAEVRRAHVPNYERRFILKDVMGGRGNPENPGLMAALDVGKGCDGLVFRVSKENVENETEILWRREFVAPTYLPRMVTTMVDNNPVQALTFVADHGAEQIVGDISREEQIQFLTHGEGILGTSLEYMTNIVSQFETLGIADAECSDLLAAAQSMRD